MVGTASDHLPDSSHFFTAEFPFLYKGIRPLGMGNAFLTIADDSNVLFYNPAGLNKIDGLGGVEIFNFQAIANDNNFLFYNPSRLNKVNGLGGVEIHNPSFDMLYLVLDKPSAFNDIIASNDIFEITNKLSDHIGDRFHMRTSFYPNIVYHNFGIGFLSQDIINGDIRNRVNPEMTIDGRVDLGGVIGVARGFMERRLQVGLSGKFIQRHQFTKNYHAIDFGSSGFDLANDFKDERNSETGFGIDVGGLYHFQDLWLQPTMGLVFQNIGNLDLGDNGTIPQMVNFGASLHPDIWILGTTLALDVNDIFQNVDNEDDFYKRIHLGAEIKFPKVLTFRVGFNQGYPTFGITVDLWILTVNYAQYTEEIGGVPGELGDKRHAFQLILGF